MVSCVLEFDSPSALDCYLNYSYSCAIYESQSIILLLKYVF